MKSLEQIKSEVDRMAAVIEASNYAGLPTYGVSKDAAHPHIEVDSTSYHWVVVERGHEQDRFTTTELDALLERVFTTVTFELATAYELAHRSGPIDCRRLIFQRQIELLSMLSPRWAQTESEKHAHILGAHPMDDLSGVRASLTRELRESGHAPEVAWQMALKRYPLPA
ncbi:MAG: hypothetical protein J0L73_02280 [Verrucomicrobia bacterium]|nr:hypothetical protein [Verrucomicrobiota bacterium]